MIFEMNHDVMVFLLMLQKFGQKIFIIYAFIDYKLISSTGFLVYQHGEMILFDYL